MPRGKRSVVLSRRSVLTAAVGLGSTVLLSACGAAGGASDAAATLRLSTRSGALRGGTSVSATGSATADVHAVTVGGTAADLVSRDAGGLIFRTPAARDFAAGSAPVVLKDAGGAEVARSTWTYRPTDGVDRQLAYLLRYWQHYNPAWEALPDDDCVDFTSQALLQRGWMPQGEWTHSTDVLDSGTAWRGSTAFRDFMTAHPELGTALTDAQRSRVKVGDIVQFDWDRSGDRDHTGTVTRVSQRDGRWQVDFAGHTDDSDFRSVDAAITEDHPGGVAYYWSLA